MNRDELQERLAAGAKIKKTQLTDKFSWDDYRAKYGESAAVLFAVDPAQRLIVCLGPRTQPKCTAGDHADRACASPSGQAAEPAVPPGTA